jgi:uncharacterized protein Yka (UPF0111/DUF47 family)
MKHFAIILGVLLFSCSKSGQEKVDIPTLKEEVLAVHDEVMPKMGELRKVEKELRLMVQEDSLLSDLGVVADKIADANQSMMVWMRGYDPNFEGTEEEVIQYLNEQKKSIQKVKEDMLSSLEEGKQLVSGK